MYPRGMKKVQKMISHFATMQEAFGEPGENPESLELVEPLLFWAEALQGTLEDLLIKLGWEFLAVLGMVSKPFLAGLDGRQSAENKKFNLLKKLLMQLY